MGKISGYYSPPASEEQLAKLPITQFTKFVESEYGVKFDSYSQLHSWSCCCFREFWESVYRFTNIKLTKGYTQVVEDVSFDKIPRWFLGAELNFTENLLFIDNKADNDDQVAIIEARADTDYVAYNYRRLREDVLRLATALRNRGVTVGDCVVAYVSNCYQTTVAVLASAAIGAVWSSASVDFGAFGVLERFSQLRPKVLFATTNGTYKRRYFSNMEKIDEIVKGLPSLSHVILLTSLQQSSVERTRTDQRYAKFSDLLDSVEKVCHFDFASVPFGHPLYIMFSSGTTGPPKGLVHTTGGTLLKHLEEHILQTGFTNKDTILFYTTCGWMMWNWLMSCFYIGMTVVLYDESPLEPDRHVLFKIAARHKCTVLGMGARIYEEYERCGGSLYDLRSIRMFLSTGSPLSVASFRFLNQKVKPEAIIGSISGGTDIVGCFLGACEILPVVEGECQCAYLGMDIAAYSEDNFQKKAESVFGKEGELVCRKPFPSMPSYFINDVDGSKYHHAYFERFQNVWAHGDLCSINPATGGVIMLGRSDATLNRGGVRIGTAEIYAVVQTFAAIADCLVVSQMVPERFDERIILFVKMVPYEVLTESLKSEIKRKLRCAMSPRHVPDEINNIPDIPLLTSQPTVGRNAVQRRARTSSFIGIFRIARIFQSRQYTISGKKVEIAVKQILNGGNVSVCIITLGKILGRGSIENVYLCGVNTILPNFEVSEIRFEIPLLFP